MEPGEQSPVVVELGKVVEQGGAHVCRSTLVSLESLVGRVLLGGPLGGRLVVAVVVCTCALAAGPQLATLTLMALQALSHGGPIWCASLMA